MPKTANRVIVFNSLKRLVAIYQSQLALSYALGISPIAVHNACTGKTMSCHGMYLRQASPNVEITEADFGVLKVAEYDKLCGITREVYPTKHMSRKGMKYNKAPKDGVVSDE